MKFKDLQDGNLAQEGFYWARNFRDDEWVVVEVLYRGGWGTYRGEVRSWYDYPHTELRKIEKPAD
jgi:hypothetical protein